MKPVIWTGSLASIGSASLQALAEPGRIDLVMRSALTKKEIGLVLMLEDIETFERNVRALLRAAKRRRRRG